jgi:cobalt-zinc-cadmium efflux system protein
MEEHDGGHDHDHDHDQPHAVVADLRIAFGINVLFTIIELVGGVLTNSVAIISDAVHDLGDSVTLGIALLLERISGKPRTDRQTFGRRRFSVLGALITGLVLITGAGAVLYHTIPRLWAPEAVDTGGMIILAILGVIMNGIAVIRLSRTESMNARAAFLHLLEDVLGWIAVLIGAIAIRIWGITWLDPLMAVLINIYVLVRAVPLLGRALKVLLQFTPDNIAVAEVENVRTRVSGVQSVHDIHLWTLDGSYTLMSCHVVTNGERTLTELEALKDEIRHKLHDVGVEHATLELESDAADCDECGL